MFRDFKEFALKGNVLDMAVGIVVGAAFTKIVNSLVTDLIMPPVGLLLKTLHAVDFSNRFIVLVPGEVWKPPYRSMSEAVQAGAVTLNVGVFLNNVVQFLITAFAVYLLVRSVNRLRRLGPLAVALPTTRPCPYCISTISVKATRCPHCTAELPVADRQAG